MHLFVYNTLAHTFFISPHKSRLPVSESLGVASYTRISNHAYNPTSNSSGLACSRQDADWVDEEGGGRRRRGGDDDDYEGEAGEFEEDYGELRVRTGMNSAFQSGLTLSGVYQAPESRGLLRTFQYLWLGNFLIYHPAGRQPLVDPRRKRCGFYVE